MHMDKAYQICYTEKPNELSSRTSSKYNWASMFTMFGELHVCAVIKDERILKIFICVPKMNNMNK